VGEYAIPRDRRSAALEPVTPDLLFVYGSLRAGGSANGLLSDCRFVGTAAVPGLVILAEGYPVLSLGPGWVHGELYQLPPGEIGGRVLSLIDRYEDVGQGPYHRSVLHAAGRLAWTYRSRSGKIQPKG